MVNVFSERQSCTSKAVKGATVSGGDVTVVDSMLWDIGTKETHHLHLCLRFAHHNHQQPTTDVDFCFSRVGDEIFQQLVQR